MFDVLAPGKLVLTLRSTPPFVAESAFALTLTILLAAPLIVRVYLLLDKPLRALTKTSPRPCRYERANRALLIQYPASAEVTESTSSSSLHPESIRRIHSAPILENGNGISEDSSRRGGRVDGKNVGNRAFEWKCSPLGRPMFPAESWRPVIDTSGLDRKAYRRELIETNRRKRCDDLQPPTDVVSSSPHLNSADSATAVRLDDRCDRSLFDFADEHCNVPEASSRRNVERLQSLDRFLPKGASTPRSSEKKTTTIPDNGADRESGGDHFPENVEGISPRKLPGADDNGNSCDRAPTNDVFTIATGNRDSKSKVPILRRPIPAQSRKRSNGEATPERNAEHDRSRFVDRYSTASARGGSPPGDDRPEGAGNASDLSRATPSSGSALKATGSLKPGTNAGRSREFKKKLEDYPSSVPSGKRRARTETGGRSNFISVSSSEIASIRSDSGERQDDGVSRRSRESSISPRSRALSRPPWLSGNGGTSFNRKYGRNIAEISDARVARPTTSGRSNSLPWQKLAVSSRGRSKEPSTASTNRNPASLKRRAASFVASREKEPSGMTIERLEGNLAGRPRQAASKYVAANNKERPTWKTGDSPSGKMSARETTASTLPDNAASSFLSSPAQTTARPRKRSLEAECSSDAPVSTRETWPTKKPDLITNRCRTDGTKGRPVSGNNTPRLSPARDRAKLNRGGRRQLRSAENPSRGASLSPQIELSAEVLNPDGDTDKSAIPDVEKPVELEIDPRNNAGAERGGIRPDVAENGEGSSDAGDVSQPRVPRIIENQRPRADVAGAPPDSRGASHSARLDANSVAESGLNGTKLNTRSNGAVDEMRYDESPSSRDNAKARETRRDGVAGRNADEELQLPRRDSKVGLAMNSALKRYIKMLKQGLLNRGDKDGVALASLSLSDAISILSERGTQLSPEEIQELQAVLDRIERNPELLRKLSRPNVESVI
ncbi:hypothetical protein PUN28_007990 [Cardiocondyla obscurior]|uniref:Uncharacterized protein n=1 Tax=Cardiocondyla obscurior TaxID=286306 RepID=A0AAW2FXK9_9HYME